MANKVTEKAGLTFNVNTVKTSMQQYFNSQGVACPKFSGAHVGTTSAIQELCKMIIKCCLPHTNKDKSGIRNLTRSCMRDSVLLNNDLQKYYYIPMTMFDKNQIYEEQLPVAKKEIMTVVNSVDKDLHLTPKANNFLNFLMMKAYLDLVCTSYQFIDFAGRKSLDGKAVLFAIKNRFTDNVSYELCEEVRRSMAAVGDEVSNVNDEEDKDKNTGKEQGEDSADEQEEMTTKTKEKPEKTEKTEKTEKAKKTTQKSKSDAKIEVNSEDDLDEAVNETKESKEEDEGKTKKKAPPSKANTNNKAKKASK